MKEIVEFIQSVGFPIFVAVYVLLRMENAMKQLGKSVDALTEMIRICHKDDKQ